MDLGFPGLRESLTPFVDHGEHDLLLLTFSPLCEGPEKGHLAVSLLPSSPAQRVVKPSETDLKRSA